MDGAQFGRYRLIELVGRGGMGEVWRAYDTETDRVVAIKVLSAHLSEDSDFQRRFRREAHAATRLNSPHVIPIHNYGEIDGRLYLDMRLIEGRPLSSVLSTGPLDPTRAVHIVTQVARALQAGHRGGLLHRDIKPANVLLDEDDFAYLIDFGIARTLEETRMTKTGSAIGTFHYIAPERLAIGADEDARADIYSLACVLYECLTGSPPFPGDTMPQLVAAHLNAPPPRPSLNRPNVPVALDNVIARGMAKDPGHRYATTVELVDAARDALSQDIAQPPMNPWQHSVAPVTAPPTRETGGSSGVRIALITGAVVLVAAVATATGLFVLAKQDPSKPFPTASKPNAETSVNAVRVTSSKLITAPGTGRPKIVITFYEDFLCPACATFERQFSSTVVKLVEIGAIAADYSMVAILDSARTQHYSSRAAAAAYCIADESIPAFQRFYFASFAVQPSETGTSFPDNARLIEMARKAGAAGRVPDCINSGKYLSKVTSAAAAAGITATPTIRINGQEYSWSTPDALVTKVREIVGDVPGIDALTTPHP